MRRSVAGLGAILAAATTLAALGGLVMSGPARAAQAEKTFLIPPSEGYGVGECLAATGSECGQVVADSWCESQGFAAATGFGVAQPEDFTGAIDSLPQVKPADLPIRITCRD